MNTATNVPSKVSISSADTVNGNGYDEFDKFLSDIQNDDTLSSFSAKKTTPQKKEKWDEVDRLLKYVEEDGANDNIWDVDLSDLSANNVNHQAVTSIDNEGDHIFLCVLFVSLYGFYNDISRSMYGE